MALLTHKRPEAALVLSDGRIFRGRSAGAPGLASGETVFNTSMTGYQEILTDPSYTGQLVTLTVAHVGNTGWNAEDMESRAIAAAGLIVNRMTEVPSNARSERALVDVLREEGIVAITDIDTRALTMHVRSTGAQPGAIVAAEKGELTEADLEKAKTAAASWGQMVGQDLASVVTTKAPYEWTEGTWKNATAERAAGFVTPAEQPYHVVAYDFGIKKNILRMLAAAGVKVTVVPARTSFEDAMAMNPDGIFLSNGPGDPAPCTYAIEVAKKAIAAKVPLFGICLGHQIMGLAVGAKTLKMKFGHHGGNHPVEDVRTHRVYITSQNHGFAVDAETLPENAVVTHRSLFDGSLQGFELTDAPAFCFQGHPEASPGPHDISPLFAHFVELMAAKKASAAN